MAIRPILVLPDQRLRSLADPIEKVDDEIKKLARDMLDTMYAAPGIGLAAPQVDLGLRVLVIDLMPDNKPAPLAMINPEILAVSDELSMREEGCLSLPGMYAEVTRPARVKVRYMDATGARKELEADDLLATCIQHEVDHLDGVLFVDHLSILKRNMIMRKLAKEQKLKRS